MADEVVVVKLDQDAGQQLELALDRLAELVEIPPEEWAANRGLSCLDGGGDGGDTR